MNEEGNPFFCLSKSHPLALSRYRFPKAFAFSVVYGERFGATIADDLRRERKALWTRWRVAAGTEPVERSVGRLKCVGLVFIRGAGDLFENLDERGAALAGKAAVFLEPLFN